MQEDIIYVIHFDGKRYEKSGLKIAYLDIKSARQIVTVEAKKKAHYEYEGDNYDLTRKEYKYWYDLSKEEQIKLINNMKEKFEIVEYRPNK